MLYLNKLHNIGKDLYIKNEVYKSNKKKLLIWQRMEVLMGIRQLRNCVIIFIVFFCGSALGLRSELLILTILLLIILPLLYLSVVFITVMDLRFDYDEVKASYNFLEEIKKEKLKAQITSSNGMEVLEDKVFEYNIQIRMIGHKIILDSENYLSNKRYKKIIPEDLYKLQKEKFIELIEKAKKIIIEN